MRRLFLLVPFLLALSAFADESPLLQRDVAAQRLERGHHYIVRSAHVLRDDERDELAARGIEVLRALPDNRYVVRATAEIDVAGNPNVVSVARLSGEKKLDRTAMHAAATSRSAFTRVTVMFYDDVSLEDAQRAISAAGGMTVRPLAVTFEPMHRLTARVPTASLRTLAANDGVYAISGPTPHLESDNAVAASMSKVDVVQQAPYGLTGKGVALSLFELSAADASHPEFGGRLNVHFTGGSSADTPHATHVAGTITATGLDERAKGMAPQATLHEFLVSDCDSCDWLADKQQQLPKVSSVADNNSWGYTVGWWIGDPDANGLWTWTGFSEYLGAYDLLVALMDQVARCANDNCTAPATTLFVHSSGNEADKRGPFSSPYPHRHKDDNWNTLKNEVFCVSPSGSGNDCPSDLCTAGVSAVTQEPHCEKTPHPPNGPFTSVNDTASGKNTVAVGAVDAAGNIGNFSSRGPTRDGRVKPDVVAKGINQYSTMPGSSYAAKDGTSMSSPVVTGISGLLVEQWRRTFAGTNPAPFVLKGLLIAGADDLGNPGPDFIYGFGLVNAKSSADLIINDQAQGKRIRIDQVTQGASVEIPFAVQQSQKLRVVLTWFDPEVPIVDPDEIVTTRVLLNDLDLKVIGPDGTTTLPYVLNAQSPTSAATRGRNSVDNTEEVEITNAAPGNYRAIITGASIGSGKSQQFAVLANGELGGTFVACSDSYEPNDTEASAFAYLVTGQSISAKACSASDLDFYKMRVERSGPVSVAVTATDTPLRVTLSGGPTGDVVADVPAGQTRTVSTTAGSGTAQPISPAAIFTIKVQSNGTIGASGAYTLTPAYTVVTPARRRSVGH